MSASRARPPTTAATPTSACPRFSSPPATSPRSWTTSATTRCGPPSTTSSTKATSACPTWSSSGLWLATQTKRLKFGCAFNVLPMWHPIRLAEDYAMADIVTDGRVIMGVGRGYHTREVETFGAPLIDADEEPRLLRGAARAHAEVLQRGARRLQGQVLHLSRPRWSIAATSSSDITWCRGRSTCRSRSGCRSPAARPST